MLNLYSVFHYAFLQPPHQIQLPKLEQILKLVEKNLNKGAVVVADNLGVFETSMRDYLYAVNTVGHLINQL